MTFEKYKELAQDKDNPEKAMAYDFREEIINFQTSDFCDRFAIYQAVGIAEKPGSYRDKIGFGEACEIYRKYHDNILLPKKEADSCSLIRSIYSDLYCDKYLSLCRNKENQIDGDTMNSVNSTLNVMLKPMWKSVGLKRAGWGKVTTVYLYERDHETYREKLGQAKIFLEIAYTIGNVIPCPVDCNRPRGRGRSKDYWDLALACIYNYFESDNDKKIRRVEKDKERIYTVEWMIGKNCKEYETWLSLFEGWDDFVETNYLQDYTEWTTKPYGRPKEFWDGHFCGKTLPQTPEQIEAFFAHAAKCIKARSARMVKALRERSENQGKE